MQDGKNDTAVKVNVMPDDVRGHAQVAWRPAFPPKKSPAGCVYLESAVWCHAHLPRLPGEVY